MKIDCAITPKLETPLSKFLDNPLGMVYEHITVYYNVIEFSFILLQSRPAVKYLSHIYNNVTK